MFISDLDYDIFVCDTDMGGLSNIFHDSNRVQKS